jgi:GNAT superfamily N-acetyltransferase
MIRLTQPQDTTALMAVASTIGFQAAELEELNALLADYFVGEGEQFWLTDEEANSGPVGVAYCEPERMTDRTWNLQLIAIRSDYQRQGRGAALLLAVEQTVRKRGGRMLLVETSGLPSFAPTRAFYMKCNYEQEAQIRDFYAAGEDKIIFRKLLAAV